MEIKDQLIEELIDRVLAEIENTVELAIVDEELTDTEYANVWNAYRKELIEELK